MHCPDCDAPPASPHDRGCDVARCTACGRQRITCAHEGTDEGWGQVWQGDAGSTLPEEMRDLGTHLHQCLPCVNARSWSAMCEEDRILYDSMTAAMHAADQEDEK